MSAADSTNGDESSPRLPDGEGLEDLVARCLLQMEEEGGAALERLCSEHPQHAEMLRRRVEWLHQSGMAGAAPGAPSTIGHYEILELLGEGAQGSVYLAQDTRLSRRVALKVLKHSLFSDSSSASRFRREAEAASRLEHPGICSVFDFGQSDDIAFIAMQFVEGETLANRIADGASGSGRRISSRVDVVEVLSYFEKAARALHAAHEAGLLHRDIKPANLMITRDGDPVILDFGLARVEESDLPTLTNTGAVMGTPAYMSVEQIQGAQGLDRRADVYSMGVSLYETLTGRRPFEGDTSVGLFRNIMVARLPDPTRLNSAISKDLKIVLETVLERDLARRYPDALTFAEELRRVRERQPIHARPAGLLLRSWRWSQRHPPLAVSVGLLIVGLIVVWALVRGAAVERDAEEVRRRSVAREVAVERDAATARRRSLALAAAAHQELENSPDLAILLAIEAAQCYPGPEANDALVTCVLDMREELHLSSSEGELPGHPVQGHYVGGGEQVFVRCRGGAACLLDARSGELVRSLRAPGGVELTASDVDSGGRRVVVGSAGGSVYCWEFESDAFRELWSGLAAVTRVQLSGDGSRLLALSGREVQLFDELLGQPVPTPVPTGAVRDAIWRPDGRALIVNEVDGDLVEVEPETGRELWRADSGGGRFLHPLFDPSGQRLLSLRVPSQEVSLGSYGRELLVWNWARREVVEKLEVETKVPPCFSPAGDKVLVTHVDRSIKLVDLATGDVRTVLRGHDDYLLGIDSSLTGDRVLSVAADATLRTWCLGQPPGHPTLRGCSEGVTPVSFDRSSSLILAAASDGAARVWDSRIGDERLVLSSHGHAAVYPALFSPDCTRILTACHDGYARIFDAETGEQLLEVGAGEGPLFTAAFSPDGSVFATAGTMGSVHLYDAPTGELLLSPAGHAQSVVWLDFSPDGRGLATVCEDGTAAIWSCEDGRRLHDLGEAGPGSDFVLFSPDGERILKLRRDGVGQIFDSHTGKVTAEILGHTELAFRGAFDPSGAQVATGSRDGCLRIWEAATGRQLHLLEEHDAMVTAVAYSPDGGQLASVGLGGVLQVWDVAAETLFIVRKTGMGPLYSLAFSPDGDRLAFGSANQVQVLPTDPLAAALERSSRELREEERQRFSGLGEK